MTNFKHLTQVELSAYHNGSLEWAERHKIGKHILTCPECRKLLPLPSVEKFWSAIMTENEPEETAANERTKFSFFTAFLSFGNSHSNLVWSSGALIIILSFSFLIWSSIRNSPKDLAQSHEINNDLSSELEFPLPPQSTVNGNHDSSLGTSSVVPTPTPKRLKADLPKSKSKVETDFSQNSERKLTQNGSSFPTREAFLPIARKKKAWNLSFPLTKKILSSSGKRSRTRLNITCIFRMKKKF